MGAGQRPPRSVHSRSSHIFSQHSPILQACQNRRWQAPAGQRAQPPPPQPPPAAHHHQAGAPTQALVGARRAARTAAAASTSSRGRTASSSSMCWIAASAAAGEACASGLMVRPEMVTTCTNASWYRKATTIPQDMASSAARALIWTIG